MGTNFRGARIPGKSAGDNGINAGADSRESSGLATFTEEISFILHCFSLFASNFP
jgi:hypothetical protein